MQIVEDHDIIESLKEPNGSTSLREDAHLLACRCIHVGGLDPELESETALTELFQCFGGHSAHSTRV
eukprot:SAG31_NODE_4346_length_3329_cov_1.499690_3_plen_67_part_00